MAIPEDLIAPLIACQTTGSFPPGFTVPGITEPGLSSMALAGLTSMVAGMTFILDFIPPDPMNLPSPPGPELFLTPVLGGIVIPGDLGEIKFDGTPFEGLLPDIPAAGPNVIGDQSGLIKMAIGLAATPFSIITGFVDSILSLELPAPPTISGVASILSAAIGIPSPAVTQFTLCMATAIVGVIEALLP